MTTGNDHITYFRTAPGNNTGRLPSHELHALLKEPRKRNTKGEHFSYLLKPIPLTVSSSQAAMQYYQQNPTLQPAREFISFSGRRKDVRLVTFFRPRWRYNTEVL